jgi:hypothetical protein
MNDQVLHPYKPTEKNYISLNFNLYVFRLQRGRHKIRNCWL